jgi:hypothetical protein
MASNSSVFVYNTANILGEILHKASKYTLQYEYHFWNRYISLFHAPAVQIGIFERNSSN